MLVVALLATATTSSADSIVFLKDGDVWLSSPDGTKRYRVTFDGGWDSPSQADDGTIVAAKGQALVRMDRSGRVIGTLTGLGGATNTIPGERFKLFGPFDPQVSPDGKRIAYWATAYNVSSSGEVISTDWRDVTLVTPSDRAEPLSTGDYVTSVRTPSWVAGDRLLVTGSGLTNYSFETWQPGRGGDHLQWWFRNVNAIEHDAELSPDGRKLVAVAQTNGLTSPPDTLHFFSVPGPAWTEGPYPETWRDDAVRPPAGDIRCESVRDSLVHSPSWSPRSDAVAYDDRDGVWIAQVPPFEQTCAGLSERLLVAGATHPDWGPADVDLSQSPSGGAPPRGADGAAATTQSPAPPGPRPDASPGPMLRLGTITRRRDGVVVRVTLARPARVTVELCRQTGRRCGGPKLRRIVRLSAGRAAVVIPTRRARRGRYTLTATVQGGPRVTRPVTLR